MTSKALDTTASGRYSPSGKQWAELKRDSRWSKQRKAVRVRIEPRSYQDESGWFWFNDTYRVESATTATLTGPNGYTTTYRNFQVTNRTSGALMDANLPFGGAGKGTYCITTTGSVGGPGASPTPGRPASRVERPVGTGASRFRASW